MIPCFGNSSSVGLIKLKKEMHLALKRNTDKWHQLFVDVIQIFCVTASLAVLFIKIHLPKWKIEIVRNITSTCLNLFNTNNKSKICVMLLVTDNSKNHRKYLLNQVQIMQERLRQNVAGFRHL